MPASGKPPPKSWTTMIPSSGRSSEGSLIEIVWAVNWSIDAATEITPGEFAGVPAMYADPPTGWLPELPAAATNTVPMSTTRCAATASAEFSVP